MGLDLIMKQPVSADRRFALTLAGLVLFILAHGGARAGGFYLPEIATPGSVGTAGAANPTNTLDSSSAITNPAAMVHLEKDRAYMVGGGAPGKGPRLYGRRSDHGARDEFR
jgi:hypothetical protein